MPKPPKKPKVENRRSKEVTVIDHGPKITVYPSGHRRLSEEYREEIKAYLLKCGSIKKTADHFGVSNSYVHRIKTTISSEVHALREIKKQDLIDRIWDDIIAAQELAGQMIQEAQNKERDIPLNQLSTFIGTMYDKREMALGKNPNGFSGEITVRFVDPT